jgi:hypothetical protein
MDHILYSYISLNCHSLEIPILYFCLAKNNPLAPVLRLCSITGVYKLQKVACKITLS